MSGFAFRDPWFLVALVPVALLGFFFWYRRRHRLDPAFRFSSGQLLAGAPVTIWARLAWLPDALRMVAATLVVIALARPQMIGTAEDQDSEGIDIVLALDTSCSMRAADFQPKDRMFVAKKAIADFIKQRSSDRIGLVVFAGEAASWVPLTLDYSLLVDMLDEVKTDMLPEGTAIGSALGTSLNRLRETETQTRVVILLTDGDNNRGTITPKKAAEFAKELGVRVYTILIGKGGLVPFPAGKDLFGRPKMAQVKVPINPELLKHIAETTGGEAYQAADSEELDQRLGDVLDSLERSKLESALAAPPREELFEYLVFAALLLLAVELLLSSTRLRRFP